jgi:hypothetical protein
MSLCAALLGSNRDSYNRCVPHLRTRRSSLRMPLASRATKYTDARSAPVTASMTTSQGETRAVPTT